MGQVFLRLDDHSRQRIVKSSNVLLDMFSNSTLGFLIDHIGARPSDTGFEGTYVEIDASLLSLLPYVKFFTSDFHDYSELALQDDVSECLSNAFNLVQIKLEQYLQSPVECKTVEAISAKNGYPSFIDFLNDLDWLVEVFSSQVRVEK